MRTLENVELKKRMQDAVFEKFGVDNIQKVPEIASISRKHQYENWRKSLKKSFPIKMRSINSGPLFRIDDKNMSVFVLKEKASVTFLEKYGHVLNQRFGKFHLSLGLVDEGILYQVLRFEKHKDQIILYDFGTRLNYFNPNYYSKIMQFATSVLDINEFTCTIPRSLAFPELLDSLSVELVKQGGYDVFCSVGDKLKKLTIRDDLDEMKKFDYVTSDYLDLYKYKQQNLS